MIQRIYPQVEKRLYIDENRCLLMLLRKGRAKDNNMSPEEFSRNVWLMDGDTEVWRIYTDSDGAGFPFRRLSWTSRSEYISYRLYCWEGGETDYFLNMKTGHATKYPVNRDRFAGPDLQLHIRLETRIYLGDGSYIKHTILPENNFPPNIVRIDSDGNKMWHVSFLPKHKEDYSDAVFDYLYIYKDGTIVAALDERIEFALNVRTGVVTPRYFP